jgi:mannose-1-phosphate guanylyltransferase
MKDRLFAVLMAGGAGTRFWPLSRRSRPKQVLPIVGGAPMVQATRLRIDSFVPPERTLVVTGADQVDAVREVLPALPEENILAEPCPRNTAACLGLAAVAARARHPDAVLLCLPADHVIAPPELFCETADRALARADRARRLVTFGIRPVRPAIGYGYILAGEEVEPGIFVVSRFVEKPDRKTAEEYVADGGYLWNSGMFAWRADVFLAEVARHLPDLASGLDRIAADPGALAHVFPRLPAISVDYGILERTDLAETIRAEFEWDDVGNFGALASHLAADERENRSRGDLLALDAERLVTVAPPGHLVAALGVADLVVIVTAEATLVCARERVQEVGRIVAALEKEGRRELI